MTMSRELPFVADAQGSPDWSFVDSGGFQCLTALVIIVNTIVMVLEADQPELTPSLRLLELLILIFYIFELVARFLYFRGRFLFGPSRLVAWNLLDISIVVAGIAEECLLHGVDQEKELRDEEADTLRVW